MGLSDFKYLKDLSWYTTVPLLVCAWMMQDKALSTPEFMGIFAFVWVVGGYFLKVVFGLFVVYVIWLFSSVHIDTEGLPLTLLLATFLLTLAAVGIISHLNEESTLFVDLLWFFSLASVAFNLFQIHSGIIKAQASAE